MGSIAILTAIDSANRGIFPERYIYYFAVLGAAFSSTYEDVANYGQDQDLLNDQQRQRFVDMIYQSRTAGEVRNAVVEVGALNMMDRALVDFALGRIAAGDLDPCKDANNVLPGFNERLCVAFGNNDLTNLLETATYPIALCHSPDDEIVDFKNLPNFSANPKLLYVPTTGKHEESAYLCLIQAMLYLLGMANSGYGADKHTNGGCPAV